MKKNAYLAYDSFGSFTLTDGELVEISESSALAGVSGGVLDFGCDGNLACGNVINFGLCVNGGCGINLNDVACLNDAVCLTL